MGSQSFARGTLPTVPLQVSMEEIVSKSTIGRRRAGLATIATSALVMGACLVAAPAQADWAPAGGEIGIVDTTPQSGGAGDTDGATLVYPGVNGQALGDVRLLIPNSFQNGDTIELAIFDRTATNGSAGQINADTAHKLGFGSVPTVSVNSTPLETGAHVGPTSGAADSTESSGDDAADPYVAPTPAVVGQEVPTTAPVFTPSLVQSSRANGLATDIIRLTVSGVQANGAPGAKWAVTLSGLKADLGAAVSPGELRVVPFSYNGAPSTTFTNATTTFNGNVPDLDNDPTSFDPVIGTYTVPAYVAPVTFDIGAPNNLIADGTDQKVGDILISETNNYSLQSDTYTITVDGADIANTAATPITVTAGNAATGETVSTTATVNDNDPADDTITFAINGASNTSKLSVKLSGLILNDNDGQGEITYTLSGGSIDDFMADPAGTSPAIGDAPPNGVADDDTFGVVPAPGSINQDDIAAPDFSVSAVSTPTEKRIGGGDRYETAAKIALNNGSNRFVVLASGENFPDALSSNYLAQQTGGGSILLTRHNALPQATLSAMRQLGTQTVYVMGGTAAVSEQVVNELKNTPQYYPGGEATVGQGKLEVIRLGGANRYETNKKANEFAAALFQFSNPVGRTNLTYGESSKLTALLATGQDYADALALGPATTGTFRGNLPLVLTQGNALSATAKSQLANFGIQQVVLAGGANAVSSAVETELTGMGIKVLRIDGADRYETATKVADFELLPDTATPTSDGGLGFDSFAEQIYLATGQKFADALAAGPLAGGYETPVLLTRTDALTPVTQTWLAAHKAMYDQVVALGLGAAVSEAALDAANAAIS